MSRNLSNSILEHIGDAIVSVDADLRIVFFNAAARDVFGFEGDVAGTHIDDVLRLVRASDEEDPVDPFRDVLASGKEMRYDKPMRVDGAKGNVYVEDTASPIRNADQEIIGVVAIFRDITENVRLMTYAKLANDRYSALFDSARSGIAVYRSDDGENFTIIDFNASAEAIEGVKRADVVGKNVNDVFRGVSRMRLLEAFRRVWATGKSERIPCAWYEDDVRKGWRDNYVYKLPTGEVVAVYDDVTDKKAVAERLSGSIGRLKDNESRFRNLFENSPIPTVAAGDPPDFKITNANRAFCDLVGYQKGELVGSKNLMDLTHPIDVEPSVKAIMRVRSSPSEGHVSVRKRYVNKDGTVMTCMCHLSKVEHDDGRIEHFAQIIDVTDQERAKAEKDSMLAMIDAHRKTIARANAILSAECDVARRMIDGTDRSIENVLSTAGRKLGARRLCVVTVGGSKMLGRWTDDGKSSTASVFDDFHVDAKDVMSIREWAVAKVPYVGDWDGMPPFLAKLANKINGQWLAVPVSGNDSRGQVGVVMLASKREREWGREEADAMVGLATLLCVLARSEKNHGELSRKIEETILELSKTVANVGSPNA